MAKKPEKDLFGDEKDLRAWVKHQKGVDLTFIEPNAGADAGVPDFFFYLEAPNREQEPKHLRSFPVWIEMKATSQPVGDLIRYKVRPPQRRKIRSMLKDGAIIMLLVCERFGDRMWLINPTPNGLAGHWEFRRTIIGDASIVTGKQIGRAHV